MALRLSRWRLADREHEPGELEQRLAGSLAAILLLGSVAPSAAGVPTFPAIGVRPGTITLDMAPRMDRPALEPPSISRELVATGLGSA